MIAVQHSGTGPAARHRGFSAWRAVPVAFALFLLPALPAAAEEAPLAGVASLGKKLFNDTILSKDGTLACATCHDPTHGFVDIRPNDADGMVSLGDDGVSLGDRNAPTAAYAAFTLPFGKTKDGLYRGGMFHDGRAADLAAQAGGPPLNPIEMAMPDKATLVARLKADEDYRQAFDAVFTPGILDDPEKGYDAMTKAIEAFEKTDFFAPFDSKYDRYLRGEYQPTLEEELGMTLFFSQQFTNCNRCHQLHESAQAERETFSNYEYHNIGVPVNKAARAVNGVAADFVDEGLLANPAVDDPAQRGRFKTPTLRNVAVTGPYMHNGVFRDLETVVRFYNKYNSRLEKNQINPETGEKWAEPEVPDTLSREDLEVGDALNEKRIKALVAFMKMLTDKRYEPLLEETAGQ